MRMTILMAGWLVAGCGGGGAMPDGGGAKRVFVTSTTYTGDLKTQGSAATGLEGGDRLCLTAATAAALGGTWTAWLSTSTTVASARIADVGPWFQLDGSKTFEAKAALDQAALAFVDINEHGQADGNSGHWTGTLPSGSPASDNCTDWSSAGSSVHGESGGVDSLDMWSGGYTNSCGTKNRLVCFEQ